VLAVDDKANLLSALARDLTMRGGYADLQMALTRQTNPEIYSEPEHPP